MTLADLIAELNQAVPAISDRNTAATTEVLKSFNSLAQILSAADERLDARERRRELNARGALDLKGLQARFKRLAFEELTPREIRLAPALFREFPATEFANFLKHHPGAWPRFLRALLRQWEPGHDPKQWDGHASLSQGAPSDAWPIGGGLPIPRSTFLSSEGPKRLAQAWQERELPDILHSLESVKVRLTRAIVGSVAVEWFLCQARRGRHIGKALPSLLDRDKGARWLPGSLTERGVSSASRALKVDMVTALLDCRRMGLLKEEERTELDTRLQTADSDFGDPRTNPAGAWEEVRQKSPEGFAHFMETLIKEDLSFFFEHSMQDLDRSRFWLNYLKSIRRTRCVLDPVSRRNISRIVRDLPEDLKRAFRRTQSFEQGEVSAFCLYFDEYVVVEFSATGNAAYIYQRDPFRRQMEAERPRDVRDLKDQGLCVARLLHHANWEYNFDAALSRLGIRPDKWLLAQTRARSRG